MKLHRHSSHARDLALARLKRINRWLIAGSIALTGALSAVAARAFPGRTLKASSSTAGHTRSPHRTRTETAPLKPPQQPPAAAPQPAEGAPAPAAPPPESGGGTPQAEAPAAAGEDERPAPAPEEHPPAPQEAAPAEHAPSGESPPAVSGGS